MPLNELQLKHAVAESRARKGVLIIAAWFKREHFVVSRVFEDYMTDLLLGLEVFIKILTIFI